MANDPSRPPVADPSRALILTLQLDELAQSVFDGLRQAHFPPGRNYLGAHLTLFHNLPGAEIEQLSADLAAVATPIGPLAMAAIGPIALGRGVAIAIDAPGLRDVRDALVRRWDPMLVPQDRQRHRPHVTIQNKVEPGEAKALHRELSRTFEPFPVTGTGLHLWRYLGGPWESIAVFPFAG